MDQIFYNGKIYTMDESDSIVSAVAVEDGYFYALGTDEEILRLRTEQTQMIDLEGKCVVPGFNDSHCHLMGTGIRMAYVDLRGAVSCSDMIARGQAYMQSHKPKAGEWVIGFGYDDNHFSDGSVPDRSVAEAISMENPVLLGRVCGHVGVVNDAALMCAGFDEHTVIEGGVLDKDTYGHLTGVVREGALSAVRKAIPAPNAVELAKSVKAAMDYANSFGVTSVQTDDLESVDFDIMREAYEILKQQGEMTVRVYEEVLCPNKNALNAFLERGLRTGDGDEYFKVGNIKVLTDGSLGARTAYLLEDYEDAPGHRGVAVYRQEELNELAEIAHKNGMQMAFHAIGDGALSQCLTALERAMTQGDKDRRHRIVHCQIADDSLLQKMAELGLCADIQPAFTASDAPIVPVRLGERRAEKSYRWKTMMNMGIRMGAGSDCPVESMNPIWGIYCAVTRQDAEGLPEGGWHSQEKLDIKTAVSLYTSGSALMAFEEDKKGMIKKGMLADMAVLSDDIFHVPQEHIKDIQADMTVIGGKVCYERRHMAE